MENKNKLSILLALKIFAFIGITVFTDLSLAQQSSGKVGLHYGYIVPDSDNVNPYVMWGLTGMAHISPSFSFGGYYLMAESEQGSGGRKFESSIHGIQALYHMISGKGDTFLGVRTGLSKVRTIDSATSTDLIFSPYHHGIVSGYDYTLTSWMSVGFEGSFLLYRKSDTTVNAIRYTEQTFKTISFLASLKIQF